MFLVMGLTFVLILGVFVTLLEQMLALWSMRWTWLEHLVAIIRRSLVVLFPLAFVVITTMTTVIASPPLVIMTMECFSLPTVATVTPVTLFRDTTDLLIISYF